jgi:hypothetical protein
VDFIIPRRGGGPVAIECKWWADQFDPRALKLFRGLYPEGASFLVAQDIERPYAKRFGDHEVLFCNLTDLILKLESMK